MSVGHELQQKRAERQLSVEELAGITKLKVSVIRALENVDVDALPPIAYVIGYLRVIAAELKLDSVDYAERYIAEFKVERVKAEEARLRAEEASLRAEERRRIDEQRRAEEVARAEALAQAEIARVAEEVARLQSALAQPTIASQPAASPRQWLPAAHWPRVVRPAWLVTPKLLQSKPVLAAALLTVVLFASVAFYTGRPAAAPVAHVAAQQTQAPPQPDAVPASATPAGPPFRAEIVLTKAAFVSASADGRPIVSREMAPGERTLIEAHTRAVVRVSDPSAVNVSIDGEPARPLGKGARSATFEVTRNAVRSFADP